ncbi:MAG: hypothetical protein HOC70_00265 [Gammaproteobacteria bacterium]|jgi:hypothetical protein|nr:hypothetical protein [Gammaproteobacteria bacterium]MBT4491646.1 hypothetical protein [Gammaproteobacteria bacterium]MBT7371795.1 hypothetical protein [Gammaproteobacteria bacterium]
MRDEDTLSTSTQVLKDRALFLKYPAEYYQYALEWCSYPNWTIEEAANLLTGCVPHRQMFLRGSEHALLDNEVLENENLIRAALHSELEVIKSVKYFDKTYLINNQIFEWAQARKIPLPLELLRAQQVARRGLKSEHYTTPCLDAARWVIENFWERANLREPPSSGAIIQAMLQQFPELSGEECDWVEKVTRHPLARPRD